MIAPALGCPRTSASANLRACLGVAAGGMQAKLEAACRTLEEGVETVRILPGFRAGALAEALSGAEVGTAIRRA